MSKIANTNIGDMISVESISMIDTMLIKKAINEEEAIRALNHPSVSPLERYGVKLLSSMSRSSYFFVQNVAKAESDDKLPSEKRDIASMIEDLSKEAGKYGLKLHLGKTKVVTNTALCRPSSINCMGGSVQVLATNDSERYLGRKFSAALLKPSYFREKN